MAWIYIPDSTSLTVSADTVASPSASDSPTRTPTSKRSATSNGTNIASKSSANASATDSWMTLPSGTTSKVSTADPGVERWIFSVLASRVSRIATPDSAREPMMTGTCGPIPSESLGRWDQDSSSWRTSQASLWEVMDGHHMGAPWLDSFPKSGMTRSGELFPLPMQAHHTSETGGGSLPTRWNTPNTMDALSAKSQQALDHENETARPGRSNPNNLRDQVSVSEGQTLWPTPNTRDTRRGCNQKQLATEVDRWPTPTSTERSGTNPNTGKGEGLSKTAKMWPTPNAHEDRAEKYTLETSERHLREGRQIHLAQVVRMFPTPRAGKTTDEDEESWLARHAAGKVATPPLALAARMLPTPTSRDYKDGDAHSCQNVPVNGLLGREVHLIPTPSSGGDSGGPHGIRGGSWAKERLVETFGEEDAVAMSGGSLSPDWVSWLMGLPVGWTSLEPLPREEYLDWLHAQLDGTWWLEERGLPRVTTGIKDRVNRLKCLGNGIVPASLALFLKGD